MAKQVGKIWMEHGALQYIEAVGEDMKKKSFCTSFPASRQTKKAKRLSSLTIVYKSRAHRDRVNKKAEADPRLTPENSPDDMPFDCKRMAWNGFETLVNL